MRKIIFGIIIILLFFSCQKKKSDITNVDIEPNLTSSEETEQVILNKPASIIKVNKLFVNERMVKAVSEEEKEKIINLIKPYKKEPFEIVFLEKVNMGIPGGDNWLVLFKERSTAWFADGRDPGYDYDLYIYAISNKVEIFYEIDYGYIPLDFFLESNIDIMENIPGLRIPEKNLSICEINQDRIEGLIGYEFNEHGWNGIVILVYDANQNKMLNLCDDIIFDIVDKNGPAPLEFINYKGRDGFKVYSEYSPFREGLPPPVNLINSHYAWYFCEFDNNINKYIVAEEYFESETEKEFSIYDIPYTYFSDNIRNINGGGSLRIDSIKEITSRIQDGRSFSVEGFFISSQETYSKIYDFDNSGKWTPITE